MLSMRFTLTQLVLYLFYIYQSSSQQAYKSYEKLSVMDNFIVMQFGIASQHLPIPLRKLPSKFNTQFTFKFGSISNKHIQDSYQNLPTGIEAWLYSSSLKKEQILSAELQQLLSGIFSFSISLNPKNLAYLSESSTLFYSSANDKFCVQHLEAIIRNILPCQNNAGIAMLFDIDTFFMPKRYVGLIVDWKDNMIKMKIIIQHYQSQDGKKQAHHQIIGLKRLKILQKCSPFFHDFEMKDAQGETIYMNQIVTDRLYASLKHRKDSSNADKALLGDEQNKFTINMRINGNWYSKNKQLHISAKGSLIYPSATFILSEILPASCQIQKIRLISTSDSITVSLAHESQQIRQICSEIQYSNENNNENDRFISDIRGRYGEQVYVKPKICRIKIQYHNQETSKSVSLIQFSIKMNLKCSLIPFDQYQSIYGGGEEIISIPMAIVPDKATISQKSTANNQIQYVKVPKIIIRVPLPDEGVPFVIITLTLVTLGYLYLAVWKSINFKIWAKKIEKRKKL